MRVFRQYEPKGGQRSIVYLQDADGVDWYVAQADYVGDTVTVCTDEAGRVCAASEDPSRLFPIDMAVWGFPSASIPQEFDASGEWMVRDGILTPLQQTSEQLAASERGWRGSQLDTTDALVQRHRDEIEDGAATTLSAEQYQELQAYRRALRDWPESRDFPASDKRPASPAWLESGDNA